MSERMVSTEAGADPRPVRVMPNAPEVYVDGYQGASYKDGVVKLNYYSLALDPATNVTSKDVVMRMTLSVSTVLQVHAALGNLIKDLEKAGVFKLGNP